MKAISLLLPSLLLLLPSAAAESADRAGLFEVGGSLQTFSGDSADASLADRRGELRLNELFAGGISLGYNFNNHFNVNSDLLFSSADLEFEGGGLDLNDNADFFAWSVNLDYYILPTRLTPFLTAGLGLARLDNQHEDDWFVFLPVRQELPISEIDFIWNVGAGIRWDAGEHWFLKLAYRLNGTELELAEEQMLLHSVILSVGYSFSGRR